MLALEAGSQEAIITVPVPSPQLWSPESPHLYEFAVELSGPGSATPDRLESYFGMRTISRAPWDGKPYEVILLNHEPVYLRGALDQALHPDSLHAYPSDDVIRGDIQLAKDLGLNMLRCHIKINDPRYYYWADKLGLLVMYDVPSPDLDTPTMRRLVERDLPHIMARDFNSPSIFAWVIFNETWGLTQHRTRDSHEWLRSVVETARLLDPSRLIEDNSTCHYDHVESDINSWHFYINDYQQVRNHVQHVVDATFPGSEFNYIGGDLVQGAMPLMNSEYGGIAAKDGDQDISWCFKYQTSELRRHAKICGYVYTELDDIEWEHNGFVNYDRSAKEFGYDAFVPEMSVADLNGADFVGCDAPPCQQIAPGAAVTVPVFVSHWGAETEKLTVRWALHYIDRFGERHDLQQGDLALEPQRFDVVTRDLSFTMPGEAALATLALTLEDDAGQIRARNYINFFVSDETTVPTAEEVNGAWILPFAPEAYSDTNWPRLFSGSQRFSATGSGWVEYTVAVPKEIDPATVTQMQVRLEAGARAGWAKIDWPDKTFGHNYPQTEVDRKTPAAVSVDANGVTVGTLHLPDDPADARGVLSHFAGVDPGAYGYLVDTVAEGATLKKILGVSAKELTIRFTTVADAEHIGGLAIYGATRGSLPVAPMVVLK